MVLPASAGAPGGMTWDHLLPSVGQPDRPWPPKRTSLPAQLTASDPRARLPGVKPLGRALAVGLSLLGAAACTGTLPAADAPRPLPSARPTSAVSAPPDPEAGRAPTPFTAAQLRDASKAGRTFEFVVEKPDAPPFRTRMIFVLVSPERATIATSALDPEGKPAGQPELSDSTWDELRRHASFPKESTTIAEERNDTPAGSFDCQRYTVIEQTPDGELRRVLWFAKELPGPPVEIRVELRGELVSETTLLRYSPGE
jgi:hypothetical protein